MLFYAVPPIFILHCNYKLLLFGAQYDLTKHHYNLQYNLQQGVKIPCLQSLMSPNTVLPILYSRNVF